MKKIPYILLLSAITLVSCSLEEDRVSFANRESSYETVFQAKSVVNSCYMPMKSFFNSSYGMGMEAATDLWYDNTSIADAICDLTPTKNGQGNTVWTQCYKGIMYCNEVIECLPKSKSIEESAKAPLIAECRVLRAFYYYYLTCTFNDVPFYTFMVKDMETLQEIRNLPRTSADEIRNFIYQDLKDNALPVFSKANGYYNRTVDIPGNRAGAPLALMLMAKAKMWNASPCHGEGIAKDLTTYNEAEKWKDAEGNPTHVIDDSAWGEALEALQELELLYGTLTEANYPLADTWWSKKNTAESIFEVQHSWAIDGVQYYSSYCRLLYPSVSDGTLDGILMPHWGTQMTTHSVLHGTKHLAYWLPSKGISKVEDAAAQKCLFYPLPLTYGEYVVENNRYNAVIDFDAIESGMIRGRRLDKRTYHLFGFGDLWGYGEYATASPTADDRTFNSVKKNGRPYAGPKFWVPDLVANYDGNNYKILRYADAILMMAECYAHLGDIDKALSYLNQVRDRAGVEALSAADETEFFQILRDERARELAGELHRRYDLVRWGIWYAETTEYNTANIAKFIKPCHEYYPIPEKQVGLSAGALTNPGYIGIIGEEGESEEGEEQFEDD